MIIKYLTEDNLLQSKKVNVSAITNVQYLDEEGLASFNMQSDDIDIVIKMGYSTYEGIAEQLFTEGKANLVNFGAVSFINWNAESEDSSDSL